MSNQQLNLKGLKVIDASTVLAGPSVGTFLAELGADVIKVEHPDHPDVTRSWKLPSEDETSSISAYFSSVNYGKSYASLDLASENGRADFIDLIRTADILIMNFKLSDYEKFDLQDASLLDENDRLIIAKISGYGIESDRVAYDLILQAESGFMSMNGQADGPPTKMPVALIDILAAHHLKEGILLALYNREKTGRGAAINVSLYDAAVSSLTNQASNYLMGNHTPTRIGSKHPNIAPYGELFESKDGKIITFAIGSDAHFKKLCTTLSMASLPSDERFQSNQLRVQNREILFELLQEKVAEWTAESLLSKLIVLNVPAGAVKNLQDVFKDPAAQALVRLENMGGIMTKRVSSVIFN